MSSLVGFGFRRSRPSVHGDRVEYVQIQQPLRRVLAFTGRSIDEVVNSPIAKNHVRTYYKLYRAVQRGCEIIDLERWWNGRCARPARPRTPA